MTIVNIHDAKLHFSKLINDTLEGKTVIISKAGVPVVQLKKYSEKITPREGGQLKGLINICKNFDAPLPKDVLETFIMA